LHFKKGARIIKIKHHSDKFKCCGGFNVPLWEREDGKEPLDWLIMGLVKVRDESLRRRQSPSH
jgi:hypothetical protein